MKLASAPGKLVLAGEYAVLHGAEALVVAVDRRLYLEASAESSTDALPPEIRATFALVGRTPPSLAVDASALRHDAAKVGLGSSAAAAAAAAALALGRDAEPARVFALALEGHRVIAPRGSGIDVAASSFGGALRFRVGGGGPYVAATTLTGGLFPSVVFSGAAARTSDLVALVAAFAERDPQAHARAIDALAEAAAECIGALERDDTERTIAAIGAHAEAMRALGILANAPIVEERLEAIFALARREGGAAKPSGAGGGDVAFAAFPDAARKARFEAAAAERGFVPLGLRFGDAGAHLGG